MNSDGDEPPPPPLRRNTGTFNRQPQRRQSRRFGSGLRYVPPRNAPPTRPWLYYQESESFDESSPVIYPLPPAPLNSYDYTPYGTRPAPLSPNGMPEYAVPPLYGTGMPIYREADRELEYERRGPHRRRSIHEYSRSRSHSSVGSRAWRRRERVRYSSTSSEEDISVRASRGHRPSQHRDQDVRPRRMPATRVRVYDTRRDSSYTDEEGDYDRIPEGKVFSFVPIRPEGQSSEYEILSGNLEIFEAKQNEGGPAVARLVQSKEGTKDEHAGFASSINDRMLHVVESQYTGDAYYDGNHSAKLTISHDPKRSRLPLFRWLHLQQRQLNLDELSAEISRIPNLSSEELHGFTKLLGQVRSFVKQYRTANSQNVKHMMPGTTRIMIQGGSNLSAGQGSTLKGNKRPMTWFCIPYLALERYSGLTSASTTSSFPNETLLQHDYAASGRVRDMEQVVVRANVAKDGECVHVDQLWGIVLDQSLLITCGQMQSSSLRDDVVKIATEPPLEAAVKARTLYISYGQSVIWGFSLDMCRTWFAFVKHFRDFWPQAIRFYHCDKTITENDWPRILNLASNARVTIELRLGAHPQSPMTGLQPLRIRVNDKGPDHMTGGNGPHQTINNLNNILPDSVNNIFHVFTWMEIAKPRATASNGLDANKIVEQLENIHNYLTSSTPRSERKSYEAAELSSHEEVHRSLETNGKDIGSTHDEEKRIRWTACVDLYNDAEIVFRFFLPWRFQGDAPTIGKFWGAIKALTEPLPIESSRGQRTTSARPETQIIVKPRLADIKAVGSYLRAMVRIIGSFQGILSNTSAADREGISVPDSLICAWLHLVMALVGSSRNSDVWRENIEVSEALIKKGMGEIMENLTVEDLLTKAVIQPIELLSLLSWKLFQDSLSVGVTLSDTYSQSLKELESNIADSPDRSHQYRIGQLKKEVEIIQSVIRAQQNVVPGMIPPKSNLGLTGQTQQERRLIERKMDELDRENPRPSRARMVHTRHNADAYYPYDIEAPYRDADLAGSNRDPDEFSKLWPIDPGGFAGFFVGECTSLLERRNSEFHSFLLEARRLEAYNMTNIDITKDKQEKAVYAFTMVTIIFLPLGTISSIFGMNTYDIANLELSQWVYWVTALPTTLIVIIGGLWWMGELQSLGRWFLRLPKVKGSRVGNVTKYPMVMAAQPQNHFEPVPTYYTVAPPLPAPQAVTYMAPSRRRYTDY